MIELDRPPVPARDLLDSAALRSATLHAARQTSGSARRRTPVLVALVAAVLVVSVVVGVLGSVHPTPKVASPPVTATPAVLQTDAGPATKAQIALAERRCVTWRHLAPVDAVLFARNVSGGAVESTAVVLRLTDRSTVACRIEDPLVSGSPMAGSLLVIPAQAPSNVVIGGVDDRFVDDADGQIVERSAVALRVTPDVARVAVVGSGPAWVEKTFQATPHDGWAYVPVEVRSTVTPRPDPTAPIGRGGAMPVGKYAPYSLTFPGPTLTVTAYDVAGQTVWSQRY